MRGIRRENLRAGFTMIELIFVIVIIAILAIVAIPKLAATRDDAKMTRIAQSTMTAATEIASYAVAQGETTKNLSTMSNTLALMIHLGDAKQPNLNEPNATIKWKNTPDCLVLAIEGQGQDEENLTIGYGSTSNDDECNRLRSLIDTERFPIPLRGRLISY